jgi:DNA polymerase III epsilon subunit-like protein
MKTCVFDVEGDGLYPTKIHCLTAAVFSEGEWRLKSTTDYKEMISFLEGTDIIVGHNITRWDVPTLERLLGVEIKCKIRDTLALSWYLYPSRLVHGLADWGEYFGVPKPKVDDWENLPIETYIHRCEEDVKINCKLWDKISKDLLNLYDNNEKEVERVIEYIAFKMDCAREAERSKWRLDVELCKESLAKLEILKEERVEQLKLAMPEVITYGSMDVPKPFYTPDTITKKPIKYLKSDGSLSEMGKKFSNLCSVMSIDPDKVDRVVIPSRILTRKALSWLNLLESLGLPENHNETVIYEKSRKEANPNSVPQVKGWLDGLGWIPISFDYKDNREIPQIRIEKDGEKILCPSVKKLIKVEPAIEALNGLTVLSHRIGILKGYLSNVDEEGYVKACIQGFTNTLRFKHKVIVNLPSVNKPYGDIVRGCLIAPEGYELCGSDMSSLEDRTKQHYMWKHDPDYVIEMQTPDFDPHLALAEFAGALTSEQVKSHKQKSLYKKKASKASEAGAIEEAKGYMDLYEQETDYSMIRHLYKTANYSCTYGAGGDKLSLTLDISKLEGHSIVKAYRDKNWAINAIAEECKTKTCMDTMWLFNPVSRFWYSLRHKKDRFSTLNQGTGVYCFDMWIYNFRKNRPQLTGQMHDEVILCVKKGNREKTIKLLQDAIEKTNKQLNLNRELGVDVQFGDSYKDIH